MVSFANNEIELYNLILSIIFNRNCGALKHFMRFKD